MEFPYTPHVESILRGRGMFKDGKLRCSATHCLFETDKKGFGREIEVKGMAACPNCTAVAKYPDDLEFEYASQHSFLKCPVCKQTISFSLIVWTQRVVSKHHRGKHLYYHKECDEATYHEVADEPEGTEEDVGTA